MKQVKWIAAIVLTVFIFGLQDARSDSPGAYELREAEGVPYLFENGMPYFTRFQDTDHNILDLAGTWKFQPDPDARGGIERWYQPGCDDADWFDHRVPGVWQAQREEWVEYIGHGWYRREFMVPARLEGMFNRLVLDGAGFQARVWLNGIEIGKHDGNYTSWSLDVSEHLIYGKQNQITVWISNVLGYSGVPPHLNPGKRLGWWEYAGIARLARIESSPEVTACKLAVSAEPVADAKGRLKVETLIYNHGAGDEKAKASIELKTLSGKTLSKSGWQEMEIPAQGVRAFKYSADIKGVALWSPDTPDNRYRLFLHVKSARGSETQEHEIGFKKFEVRGTSLYLNGKPYYIRGLNRHEDDKETGLYQSDSRLKEDLEYLKDLRVNHIRGAHYPNDPRWLDMLDRGGISFCEEIPLYQADSGSYAFWKREKGPDRPGKFKILGQQKDPALRANAIQQLVEMIERDRNHACMVMWSLGNENLTYSPASKGMYRAEIEVARRFDPDRVLTWALLSGPVVSPLLECTADLADVISINQYYGWYFGKVEGAGPYFDRVHKKYPNKPIIISEFGADASPGNHAPEGVLEKFTEEYQVYILEKTWKQMLERPYIAGGMPWIFADFRCGWTGKMHPVFHMNEKGVLSYDREKKSGYHALKNIYTKIENSGK